MIDKVIICSQIRIENARYLPKVKRFFILSIRVLIEVRPIKYNIVIVFIIHWPDCIIFCFFNKYINLSGILSLILSANLSFISGFSLCRRPGNLLIRKETIYVEFGEFYGMFIIVCHRDTFNVIWHELQPMNSYNTAACSHIK